MTTTISIYTDADFLVPINESTVHFGTYKYLIVTTQHPVEYLCSMLLESTDTKLIDLLTYYIDNPTTYLEFGNYEITIKQLDATPDQILDAAKLLKPIM